MPSRTTLHVIEIVAVGITLGVSYFTTAIAVSLFVGAELGTQLALYRGKGEYLGP